MHWDNITYLRTGSKRQRMAYDLLCESRVMALLTPFHPILTGTFPLALDTPTSDLDIICQVYNHDAFVVLVEREFGGFPDFTLHRTKADDLHVVVCNFTLRGMPFEIFAQPRPTHDQNAYRHMVVEARLLEIGGAAAHEAIGQLKAQGIKTEPAFGKYFGLPGDPYQTLLALADLSDAELLWTVQHTRI